MPVVDLVDETFVVAPPARVAADAHDAANWRRWWPDLDLVVFQDRGEAGLRWSCTGALVGSLELWLEPVRDGVLVHHYLRADPTRRGSATEPEDPERYAGARGGRRQVRLREERATAWKVAVHAWKDALEAGRPVGGTSRGEPWVPTGTS